MEPTQPLYISFIKKNIMKLGTFIDRPILACVISALILLAKTAILITEYAATRRRQGMTVLTMVIGMLPLVFASGAGANGNVSLGTGVVGGMIVGTIALLFVVPSLFIVFQAIEERVMPRRVHE